MVRKQMPSRPNNEADILEEMGAEPRSPDDPGGVLLVDEAKIREAGAVDVQSIRANRRVRDAIDRKSNGEKNVSFDDPNILLRYEDIGKHWPLNTITIYITRLTGTPWQNVITSQPMSGADLYVAIQALHGRSEEAKYDLVFRDTVSKERRGGGQITMPSTMVPPQVPPPPVAASPVASAPVPPPTPQQPHGTDPVAIMRQMFDMMRQMQQPQSVTPPMQMPQMGTDANTNAMLMAMQMFEMMRMQQQPAQPIAPAPLPPPPPPAPQVDPIAMMKQMFEMVRAMQPPPAPTPRTFTIEEDRPAYRGPRPYDGRPTAYGPRPSYDRPSYEDRNYGRANMGGYRDGGEYSPPQQPPKSETEKFREAASVIRSAIDLANEFSPIQAPQQQVAISPEEDPSPVRIVDAGPAKLVFNEDGSARYGESVLVNLPSMLKWGGEQFEKLQKNAIAAAREREANQQRQQLPPGYVEMTPGYQPPPGFVAVPVDQIPRNTQQAQTRAPQPPTAQAFPEPPMDLPPPLSEEQAPQEEPWGMPDIGGEQ